MARRGVRAKGRYRPLMWAHQPEFNTYSEEGEPWFGFEAVRDLEGLPPEILLVPLFGHTFGHCGVAVRGAEGWLLHAGDSYFDPREVKGPVWQCAPVVRLFQMVVTMDTRARFYNQARLRSFTAAHPEVRVFCAHNPWELEDCQAARAERLPAAA
ncbi:hypothetical protein ABLE93_15800 [Xanthobacter sp. KR7-65]|uniref:hypothetical protein n=1 Tax=Xanthobacter sp. KR7-65 TaxID=3156612 RepID=UPI0032B3518D